MPQNQKSLRNQTRDPQIPKNNTPREVWDDFYDQDKVSWRSRSLSSITEHYLTAYAKGKKLLEIGCGTGDDSAQLVDWGADYLGLDISESAINRAKLKNKLTGCNFLSADFFCWKTNSIFDIIYDKGFFHNLSGFRHRKRFVRRIAGLLSPGGIWTTVCGSADSRLEDFDHGAIFLRDLIEPAEIYFEILEVKKDKYNLLNQDFEFSAWYAIFKCR